MFTMCGVSVSVLSEAPVKPEADISGIEVPVILPDALVTDWLQNDPEIAVANNAFDAAKADAAQTAASPYEWNASYTKQQRDYGTGPKSDEWNASMERTIRLPGKYSADKTASRAAKTAACAERNLDMRAAATHLLDAYLDWQAAHSRKILLSEQQQLAQRSFDVVTKRVKSGDASMLEQKLASAELMDIQRQSGEADIAEASTWAQFSSRYPAHSDNLPNLPDPVAISHSADWWQARITDRNDKLQVSRAQQQVAQATADRARADRIPDPTVGIFTGKEAYGDESIVGVSISMPIPGTHRSLERQKQLAQSNRAYQEMVLTERQLNSSARSVYASAIGHYQHWQLAQGALVALRDNIHLEQRAYALGEQDLQALLLAQRQGLAAAQAEVDARIDALRSYYTLLLEAKLLWPTLLEHRATDCATQD
ncbi:MAG TPA: TolC family protein [Pseudomonadales bacterium]|nr:TolC family protein [Pseudomonadales bacterium]